MAAPPGPAPPGRVTALGAGRVTETDAAARKRRHLLHTAARIAAIPVLVAALVVVPVDGAPAIPSPGTALAAGTCTGWPDDAVPPTTIRVLRTTGPATGTVQVVPFHDYVTVVMAAEWGPGNPPEALKAGAVAAKEYAWYYAMFWRGRSAPDGSCYDVSDSSVDQVYSPETRVPAASIVAAVDASWGMTVRRNTGLFVTHYQAGANVACGANADGGHLYQVSAAHCAQDGMTADQILQTYYGPGVEIEGGTAPAPYPVGLRFLAQPSARGTADVAFPVQPVVAVVDATGGTFVGDAVSQPAVTLSLGTPLPGVSLSCTGGLSRRGGCRRCHVRQLPAQRRGARCLPRRERPGPGAGQHSAVRGRARTPDLDARSTRRGDHLGPGSAAHGDARAARPRGPGRTHGPPAALARRGHVEPGR